ncbi:hypothetical protein PHISP_05703 [Aspergillus sp. HF37]|nr:hypothetical protein PHISP_05703 [Aspergillus sp. HF37]
MVMRVPERLVQPMQASTSSATSSTKAPSSTVSAPGSCSATTQPTGSSSFAKTAGLEFTIDGETKYFAGSNSYWLPFLMMMRTLTPSGTVYFQVHDKSTGTNTINTGPDGLQRLDYVVSAAEKYGIKLIVPLVNNWDDYGGMSAYINAYGGNKTGWYTNEKIQSVYQEYIKAVVSRYRDSPAIFSWELGNEPRCRGCSTDVIYDWATKTSAYIKSLDANHMVSTGGEGMGLTVGSDGSYPYTYYEGYDFEKNIAIPDIDFGVFHMYTSQWGISDYSWGNGWVRSHAQVCQAAGKPCMFEEYGIKEEHCGASLEWQDTCLSTTGMAADLFWQYGQQLSTGLSPDDQYTIYYGTDEWQCAVVDHISEISEQCG